MVAPFDITAWQESFSAELIASAANALEDGDVLYAPRLRFELSASENRFLSPEYLDSNSKNVSWRPGSAVLTGTRCQGSEHAELLGLLRRYHAEASSLLRSLLPQYADSLTSGFTSFRPAEIAGRATAWRSDDTRLHVDAFPSRPMRGLQILRVFSNVNLQTPRVWRIGEAFEQVAARFLPQIPRPLPGSSLALYLLRKVHGLRTEYDHYMLGIHDAMKADDAWQFHQSQVPHTEFAFPPGATWICFTDRVSHAAISGRYAFEQTFYLPVSAMQLPQRTPLRILERLAGHRLA